jgi:hypothetical protein
MKPGGFIRKRRQRQLKVVVLALVAVVMVLAMLSYWVLVARSGAPEVRLHRRNPGAPLDHVTSFVERDPELPRLIELAMHDETANRVTISVTLGDMLPPPPAADRAVKSGVRVTKRPSAFDEGLDCGVDIATHRAVQNFTLQPLGGNDGLSPAMKNVLHGSAKPILEAFLSLARSGRIDDSPAIGITSPKNQLVFGASRKSGVNSMVHIDLTDGRLLVGVESVSVTVGMADDLSCWRAIAQRRTESRQTHLRHLVGNLTLVSVKIIEERM